MLEIENHEGFFICDHKKNIPCGKESCELFDEPFCSHTINKDYALNEESIDIFNKFFETFNVIIDDDMNLVAWEKTEDEKRRVGSTYDESSEKENTLQEED